MGRYTDLYEFLHKYQWEGTIAPALPVSTHHHHAHWLYTNDPVPGISSRWCHVTDTKVFTGREIVIVS